ncbi:MAG TPA: sigma-54 dependent transcriptional regulator [Rectinemataceae bacterium]|nr:sigma-54 dependent transcriptional regulator [Rectinemataceae bacterium]
MATILVIDDEPGIRSTVRDILEDEGHRVLLAEDAVIGLELMSVERPDLAILDVWLPRMGGLDALAEIKRRRPELEVVVVTGHGTIDMAVRALKLGAFDFIEKPLSMDRLLTSARNALEIGELRRENKNLKRAASSLAGIEPLIGSSPAMAEIRALIDQAAGSDARILITGENGTGKELVARSIHHGSRRAERPFVEVNCAAIPDTLLESELFGHERGAFTDAVSRRAGRFETADGGTLFLDEVADLSLAGQAKVLRVLQEMRFERLGSEKTISVDVRVIAATNKDIRSEIAAGRFREDLYFRLAVVPIHVPPLRERRGDVLDLCRYFLDKAASAGAPVREISAEGLELLGAREWLGNVRELANFLERLAVMSDERLVSAATVARILGEGGQRRQEPGIRERYGNLNLAEARELFERDYLVQKLRECAYNIPKAAEAAGISPSGLHAKVKKYGIEQER